MTALDEFLWYSFATAPSVGKKMSHTVESKDTILIGDIVVKGE